MCQTPKIIINKSLPLFFLLSSSSIVRAAEEGEGVSLYAYPLFDLWGIPITNAIVTSWVISLFIIITFRLVVKKPQLIPSKGQAIVENLIEGIRGIVVPIVGKKVAKVAFPLLIGFFTFILIHNWSGLLPGVGTFGFWEGEGTNRHLTYFFRPANADLNMTLALAIVSFVAWLYITLRYAGIKVLAADLFGNKADKNETHAALYFGLFGIFFAVGLIEVISIIFRPISLSLRLFGNVFGGENLLTNITGLIGWIVPAPFYFLEMLVGLVQALVFTILVSVYIGLICNHEGGDHSH